MIKKLIPLLFILLISFTFSSCASRSLTKPRSEIMKDSARQGKTLPSPEEELVYFQQQEKENQERLFGLIRDRANEIIEDSNYRVGANDEIEINVFDVPELNVTTRVRQTGHITLPLVGAVPVAGLNEKELTDRITQRVATYVKNPQVTAFISSYGSQKVAVLGAVKRPGTYSLRKGLNSVLELIGESGGLSEKAGNFLTFVPTEISGVVASTDAEVKARMALASQQLGSLQKRGIEIELGAILGTSGGIPLEIPVRGGDMIVVPETGQVMVEGEVEKRGSYTLTDRMSLLGALAAAGGITYGAKLDEVEVIRNINSRRVHLVFDLEQIASGNQNDVKLKGGDLVRVPSHSGRRLRQDTFDSISRIVNVGGNLRP